MRKPSKAVQDLASDKRVEFLYQEAMKDWLALATTQPESEQLGKVPRRKNPNEPSK